MPIGSQTETSQAFATIQVRQDVTAGQIADQMSTFIESGISRFWCSGAFLETGGSSGVTVENVKWWYAEAKLFAADDFMIRVLEDEDETGDPEDGKAHLISKKEMVAGLERLAADPEYAHHFRAVVDETGDANTADIMMQFILFGKEVYA